MRSTERINGGNRTTESISRAHLKLLDIIGLKLWAEENLPLTSQIRSILLVERDSLTVEEFIAKMDIWLKLIDMESNTMK
jgi:hypothetical protein